MTDAAGRTLLQQRGAAALGWAALALVAVGAAAGLVLHGLQPGLDPRHRMLSDYGDTEHRPVLVAAYVAIGGSGVVAAFALRLRHAGSRHARTGAWMLVAAGATILGLALWPDGVMHIGLVRAGQGAMLLAVGAFAMGARERADLRVFGGLSWALVVLTAMGIARMEWLTPWPALTQRMYWVVLVAWVVAGALHAIAPGRAGALRAPSSSRS